MKIFACRLRFSIANTSRNTHRFYGSQTHKLECSPQSSSVKSRMWDNVDKLFDEMPQLDVVSLTTLIGQFARQHQYKEAVYVFCKMLLLNIKPNEFTLSSVICSSKVAKDFYLGKQLHACAMKIGLNSIVFVGSALLDFYAKSCSIEEARNAFVDIRSPNVVSYTTLIHGYLKKGRTDDALQLFKEMPERNVVSWNAVIGGFSQTGHNEEAVNLFVEMLREGFVPDQCTFPCLITAASNIASLGIGKSFHAWVVKLLCSSNVFVGNSLVSFYAKCGSMEDSLLVFNELPERNIVTWNAVICGFAQNGRGVDAVVFFKRMRDAGLRPNDVTLLGVLWACNHAGLVDKGLWYFNQIRVDNPGVLNPEHYACVVDLLSRFGRFKEATEFLRDLPYDPGIGFWKALLGGCHIHSNTELSSLAAQKILALDPKDVSSYIMLSNAYSAAGKWQDVSTIRRAMKKKGLTRIPGCSWIEVGSKIHVFTNTDKRHQRKDEIYSFLNFCMEELREIESSNTVFVDY